MSLGGSPLRQRVAERFQASSGYTRALGGERGGGRKRVGLHSSASRIKFMCRPVPPFRSLVLLAGRTDPATAF